MKIKSNVKSGGMNMQHNEKLAGDKKSKGLIVKTSIKSGYCPVIDCGSNHNEKLADDTNVIGQKKSIGKKLRLSKETIRELKDSDLKRIAGGGSYYTASCNVTCR